MSSDLKVSPRGSLESRGFEPCCQGEENPTEAKRIGAQSPRPFMAHSGPEITSPKNRGQFDVRKDGRMKGC